MTLSVPPEDIHIEVWIDHLRRLARQNLPPARREALLRLLWQESYLTRPQLIARIEAILGFGCFGSSPRNTFSQDIRVVRQSLEAAGRRLRYSRRADRHGYFIEGQPILDERIRRLIAGSAAEVDPAQIAIYKRLAPAQRIWQLASLSDWLRLANKRRLQQNIKGRLVK